MTTSVTDIRRPEWRSEHASSRYPFADRTTLLAGNGDFIPETAFLDASLHVIGAQGRVRLSQIRRDGDTAIFTLGDDAAAGLASCEISVLDPPDVLTFYDEYGRSAGTIITESNRLSFLRTWSAGTRTFTAAAAEFCITCCLPVPAVGFRGFLLDDGTILAGDILIVGGPGIVLSARETTESTLDAATGAVMSADVTAIRIDVVGDPLFRRAACSGEAFVTPRFVRQLKFKNGCQEIVAVPDAAGDVKIDSARRFSADPSLRLQTTGDGIHLELTTKAACGGAT